MIGSAMKFLVQMAQALQLIAIWIGVKVYQQDVTNREEDQKRDRVIQSLEFLQKFQNGWEVELEELNQQYDVRIQAMKEDFYRENRYEGINQNEIDEVDEAIRELVVNELETERYFNKLEYLAIYINYQVVDVKIVRPLIEESILGFVARYQNGSEADKEHRAKRAQLNQLLSDWRVKHD